MTYPKYLAPKTLAKRYEETGASPKKIEFIKTFCLAAANLYGAIFADELWDVYKELAGKANVPKIRRKELYAVMGVLRREELPYYVYEVDEVYSEEPRVDKNRILVVKSMVGRGYGKLMDLYHLFENMRPAPFYVPEDFLDYSKAKPDARVLRFEDWLGGLKCTEKEYTKYGMTWPCKNVGKKLRDCTYISDMEEFDLKRLRGEIDKGSRKPDFKLADEMEREFTSVSAPVRIVRIYMSRAMIGWPRPTDSVRYFIDSLEEMGVAMSKYKLDHIAQGLMEINNNAHLWCIRGWTPYDLHREALKRAGSAPGPKPELVMGPGYQKAFENGDMDRDELIRSLEKMGFKVSMQ